MIKQLKRTIVLAAVLAAAGTLLATQAVQAQDALTYGFEVNSIKSSTGKRIFNYDAVSMTLSVTQNATVDLTINDLVFDDADFDFSAKAGLTTTTVVGTQTLLLTPFTGTFSFFEKGTGTLILQATFQDAILSTRENSRNGALFQSDDGIDTVQFTIGPALGGTSASPEGFSFALGGANPKFTSSSEGHQLNSFSAKASFEADSDVIPEPSALILTAFGMLGFAALRRR